MSKIYKPDFYDRFRCTADKCSFNCCQQWDIAVDEKTLQCWKQTILNGKRLVSEVIQGEHGCQIRMGEDHQCPFLDETGLCKLVSTFGEEILSETCKTFPRQIQVYGDRVEYSLMPGCPEVIEYLYQTDRLRIQMVEVEEAGQATVVAERHEASEKKMLAIRDKLLEILQDERYSVAVSWMTAFYVLLELQERECLEVDYTVIADQIAQMETDPEETIWERNELLLDMVAEHQEKGLYIEYLDPLVERAEEVEDKIEALFECCEMEEAESFFRNYLCNEVYSNLCFPGAALTDMILSMEWISLTYACIRQAVLLGSDVRESVMFFSRIMGFAREDSVAYLEECFEEPIWDLGYMFLLLSV